MGSTLPRRPTRPDHERRKQKAITLAVGQYNHGLYFECHETLEEIWLEEAGEDRNFLQGIIQAAAALHNLQRGRSQGPARLLQAARTKLLPYGPTHLGVNLRALCAELEKLHRQAVARDASGEASGDHETAEATAKGTPWIPSSAPRIPYREPPFEYK